MTVGSACGNCPRATYATERDGTILVCDFKLVPEARLELARLAAEDFEFC